MTSRSVILHVLGKDTLGGCERLTLDLAKYFESQGFHQEVVFLTPGTGPISPRFHKLGVKTHICLCQRNDRFDFVRRLARLCRMRQIDSVLSHAFGLHFFIALGARLGTVRRFLALVGNPPPPDHSTRLKSMLLAQAARLWVYREVACSHYVAQAMERVYRLPSRRISVIHNWGDVEAIRSEAALARALRQDSGPVLGMAARLDPIKDHPTVLKAFARFYEQCPTARLRLIGDGPTRSGLEALAERLCIADAVEFLGSRQDIAAQLGALDLFVYGATQDEGFGIVLAEAMAAGTPIICTDIGPCAEVLDGGLAGYLVPPYDPSALADGMTILWQNAVLREQLRKTAQALVEERYSLVAGGQAILGLLHV